MTPDKSTAPVNDDDDESPKGVNVEKNVYDDQFWTRSRLETSTVPGEHVAVGQLLVSLKPQT
jgi:hypothetical protein